MSIETKIVAGLPQKHVCDLLALLVREVPAGGGSDVRLQSIDKLCAGLVGRASTEEEFRSREGQTLSFHGGGKLTPKRILIIGLGKSRNADRDRESLRVAAAKAVRSARTLGAKSLAISWPASEGPHAVAKELCALAEGASLGAYRFDKYLSEKKPLKLVSLRLMLDAPAQKLYRVPAQKAELEAAVAEGRALADATCLARDLVNEPAAAMTPRILAEVAEASARKHGLVYEVHGRNGIEKLGMNLFLAVSQGSAEKPQLVKISYLPKGEGSKKKPLALIGKAITFDSGGLSIKTAAGMEDMKVDMAGAAAVIAAMELVARMAPPFPVLGFFGACENMPSGTAYRPGDIVKSKGGPTVEVLNTDAEGRLVLADVLAWAVEHQPAAMVDLATLTGAIMVALGPTITGLFSNDDALAGELIDAAASAGESVWRMPLPPEMEELIKSPIADLKNIGGRYGGAISAALFLQRFVGKVPWVHLDIAGPASMDKERGVNPRGGTGAGVRLLAEWIKRRAASAT